MKSGTNQSSDLSSAQRDQNYHWFKVATKIEALKTYPVKRGFKLFGYSSDESLKLLSDFNKTGYGITRETITAVDNYLADEKK